MQQQNTMAVLMNPMADISYRKDSTLALLVAARDRGWRLLYMEQSDLTARGAELSLRARELEVRMDPEHWYDLGEYRRVQPDELDLLLMRRDPPFDMEFVYCTYLLEALVGQGVRVVNAPRALRDLNEKAALMHFCDWAPEFIISRNMDDLMVFADRPEGVVIKPLDGMGGRSIYRLRPEDTNAPVIVEDMTDSGRRTVMAQQYIPEIAEGDRRVFVLDGEPVDLMLKRTPAAGELRGNLAAGAQGEVVPTEDTEMRIASQVGPELKRRGVLFAGLDVIGDYLTEVNVTSPTGLREVAASGRDLAAEVIATIAEAR